MPQQNGVSKRMNETLMEKSKSMLSEAYLGQDYWVEAVDIACYVVNRSSTSDLVNKTPYEAWDGKNPSLAHIIVFGCDAFVHVPKEEGGSLKAIQRSVS